jgi:hypothetical protein
LGFAEPIEPPKRQLVFAAFPPQADGSPVDIGKETYSDKNVKLLIIDLLCVWVRSHTYRFKYFLLRNNLCVKILRVLRYRESHIVLGTCRCFPDVSVLTTVVRMSVPVLQRVSGF